MNVNTLINLDQYLFQCLTRMINKEKKHYVIVATEMVQACLIYPLVGLLVNDES